ncbi:MAG: tyrosine-type recombinase/integrase [Bacteroidia bacterium]
MKKKTTTCSAIEWNTMLGLCERLKADGYYREYLLILLGSHFGLRISDLLLLTWEQLQSDYSFIVQEGKTKKVREIKLNIRIQEALDCMRKKMAIENTSNPIFSNRWGQPISVSYVNKRMKWIFVRYRIKTQNPSTHTLRKTFGMRVFQMHGESERALIFLSEVFGHSSTAITRRYLGITQQEISSMYLDL